MTNTPLLEVNSLTLDYILGGKKMRALDKVSFTLGKGEVMGVAGESGCGKSTMGLSIIGLLPRIAKIPRGEIVFEGDDLLRMSSRQMDNEIRGQKISMIFQNPQNALNPVFRIGSQMTDILKFQEKNRKVQRKSSRQELYKMAVSQLRDTGISDPDERISNYPFEFSGGMKQRVMIAMALSSQTSLLIADEPTTALDMTIEAQILELLTKLKGKYDTSILYISHNLGVLSQISDRIMIMYAGRIFEMGPTNVVLGSPRHPYSSALLESLPGRHTKGKRLLSIPGHVPSLDSLPIGCSFHPRCPFAEDECSKVTPSLEIVSSNHWSACLLDQRRGRQKWKWI
ncbi:MAG: ABC transporter ATP-binding protein [Desulfobacteraceae bacterium]|nr:ABC transporter ATP-binding protein [Desulfobacteraceae bacterium]